MKELVLAIALTLGSAVAANGQCPNCQPTAQAQQPQMILVRQRRGLFGWRVRWVAMPASVQPAGVSPILIIR